MTAMATRKTTGTDDQQSVNVLLRFRETLKAQRDKLARYLKVLEQQEKSIRAGDVDGIVRQAELETALLREIEAVQKVLSPLEALYVHFYPSGETQIPPLRRAVIDLRTSVLRHNRRNRDLLRDQLHRARTEIEALRIPAGPRSTFSSDGPSLIDIST
jgi:hypothetical protein